VDKHISRERATYLDNHMGQECARKVEKSIKSGRANVIDKYKVKECTVFYEKPREIE
jgi:hypothetical protein